MTMDDQTKGHDYTVATPNSNSSTSSHPVAPQEEAAITVAVREQRRVAVAKWVMMFVLLSVAVALSAGTYFLVKKGEEDDFEQTFEHYVSEIIAVSQQNVETAFLVIQAFANTITIQVKASGDKWPNVTIDSYTSQANDMVALAGRGKVTFAPLVGFEERLGFEEYARGVVHSQVQEHFDFVGSDRNATDMQFHDQIVQFQFAQRSFSVEPYDGPDVQAEYLVNWQNDNDLPEEGEPNFVMNNLLRVPTVITGVNQAKATKRAKVGFFDGIYGITSQVLQPIFQDVFPDSQAEKREIKAFLWMTLEWDDFFINILPENANGTRLVMESSCGFSATYEINGLTADFIGLGNLHDPKYNDWEIVSDFFSLQGAGTNISQEVCEDKLTLRMYPTDTLKDSTTTNKPIYYAAAVAGIFLFTSAIFVIYDLAVGRRQQKVMARIITQDKIVSNLFPPTIRDRLYGIGDQINGGSGGHPNANGSMRGMFDIGEFNDSSIPQTRPIADLFLETTVMFADISGFTAWSSAREPTQVFILLENLYGAFDKLCHKHGVFKIETIGDCYVAVAGLPLPNKAHAAIMAKFTRDCVTKMKLVTTKMEIDLGPDTGDLDIRIGVHSGQVTAGVLRGERSRFQLFGDTVNVAARMESTGERGKIHISETTAELLIKQGRGKWVTKRGDTIIRGRGTMITYWLETKEESDARNSTTHVEHAMAMLAEQSNTVVKNDEGSERSSEESDEYYPTGVGKSKKQRLVEWNVEILSALLKRILAARATKGRPPIEAKIERGIGKTVLEEFEEIITLPKVTMDDLKRRRDPDDIVLEGEVVRQLRRLLGKIADLYRDNSFHSFEHASHVTASVAKLLSRIVTSDTTLQTHGPNDLEPTDLAGHSYGITSDPLTQFAVVFSAIIHDVDHPGVPNAQLVLESDPMATKYKGKSIAEQNSVDLVWDVLLQPEFSDLRACIYSDEVELKRFRQLLVNVVMATDIADKELGALRKARWNKAFDPEQARNDSADLVINRKATIVLEHLIQASDVSHTMQHWQVYKKWNQKYFNECYSAWKSGRAATDPSLGWYEGEIGFFEYYIIPLAKKLDSCGVFGVSSHEYLNYATSNLEEWKKTGQEVVKEFMKAYEG